MTSKRPNLMAGFEKAEPVVVPIKSETTPQPTPTQSGPAEPAPLGTPQPTPTRQRKDPRANRQAFTVWLDRDLVARLRALSRDLVDEHGRAGNSIEALMTRAIESTLKKHGRS